MIEREVYRCTKCDTPCVIIIGRNDINVDIKPEPNTCIFMNEKCSWIKFDPLQILINMEE